MVISTIFVRIKSYRILNNSINIKWILGWIFVFYQTTQIKIFLMLKVIIKCQMLNIYGKILNDQISRKINAVNLCDLALRINSFCKSSTWTFLPTLSSCFAILGNYTWKNLYGLDTRIFAHLFRALKSIIWYLNIC